MNHESHSIPALWENHGQIMENMGKHMEKNTRNGRFSWEIMKFHYKPLKPINEI